MTAKISRREQNVLIAGGTIVFIVLFIIYLLQPKWEQYQNDQTKLVGMKSQIETLKVAQAKKIKEKPETVESLKNQVRILRGQLPVTKETAGFANFIVKAVDTAGLTLYDISMDDDSEEVSDSNDTSNKNTNQEPEDSSKNQSNNNGDDQSESTLVKGTTILPVTVRVVGSYKQIRDFTISLESLERLNHIKSIIFARDKETGILMCEIALDVYSWKKGDPTLNDLKMVPRSPQPGKVDPYDSVSSAVYKNLGFDLRWDN